MSAALRPEVCACGSEDGSDCSLEAEGLVAGVPGRVWDNGEVFVAAPSFGLWLFWPMR